MSAGRTRAAGRIVLASAALAVAALAGAGIASRDLIAERWLIWRLHSADEAARLDAAERLADRGSAAAVPHLIALLERRTPQPPTCLVYDVLSENLSEIFCLDRVEEAIYRIGKPAVPGIDRAIAGGRSELLALRACILEPARHVVAPRNGPWCTRPPPTP